MAAFLLFATIVFATPSNAVTTTGNNIKPYATSTDKDYLYYVTQPTASQAEADTYIRAFNALQTYRPSGLITMMVNEAGPKIQVGVIAAAAKKKYKVICNFNIGNNMNINPADSYTAFLSNSPEICTGGYAIDYEPNHATQNYHIGYFQLLIPKLHQYNNQQPIYVYFNPRDLLTYAESVSLSTFNSFVTLLSQNNVTMLWPVYSRSNAESLHQLLDQYSTVEKLPRKLLFNLANSSTLQSDILNTLKINNVSGYDSAFWEVINNAESCPENKVNLCDANIKAQLSPFNKSKSYLLSNNALSLL